MKLKVDTSPNIRSQQHVLCLIVYNQLTECPDELSSDEPFLSYCYHLLLTYSDGRYSLELRDE